MTGVVGRVQEKVRGGTVAADTECLTVSLPSIVYVVFKPSKESLTVLYFNH